MPRFNFHRYLVYGFVFQLSLFIFANPFDEEHPGHSSQGPAFNEGPRQRAKLYTGMGKVDFPITTKSAVAQSFFNQGIAQLHGFFSFEAERSFRTAAAYDPECAVCYWGMAMANTVDMAGSQTRGKEFISLAKKKMAPVTDREKLWILSLSDLYETSPMALPGREAYVKQLEQISIQYPSDTEAKAFRVLTLWENFAFFKGTLDPLKMDNAIEEILSKVPYHPVHHYKIHLWDSQKTPEVALKSSGLCGPSAPEIAHMWHMPGHIYWKLHRYADSAWQQEASARVDHKNMLETGNLPYQIGNYLHIIRG